MDHQLTSPSGREDENLPWSARGSNRVPAGCLDADPGVGLGVRPGESDPGRMLGVVLLLVVAAVVLGLAWWLV